VPYLFGPNDNAEQIVERLAANGWQGEIVGPHGSGKSTLLATLQPQLIASGRNVASITLRNRQRHLPHGWLTTALASSRPLLIIDGYEQLTRMYRAWLRWQCRRSAAGMLVTSHAATGLPRLLELQPTRALVDQLVAQLTVRAPSAALDTDVAAGFACHGSNVRKLLFELYGCHEARARALRTAVSVPA
jgi:energy-coupling factor transporter ATP-binding protein EcfA2